MIGIVEQKNVARVDVAGKKLTHRLGRVGQCPDMDRDMLGLGDQPAVEAADRGRKVAARIEDLRIRCAQHGLAHLFDDGQEAMADDRRHNRIDTICQGLHLQFARRPPARR